MSDVALDASAVLALLAGEPGAEEVAAALPRAVISAVNLSEALAKLVDAGVPANEARTALRTLTLEVSPFDEEAAFAAGALRPATRGAGPALGDRACLALAAARGIPAVTTDRAWRGLRVGVPIRVAR